MSSSPRCSARFYKTPRNRDMGPLPGPKEPAPSNPRFRIDRADSAGAPGKQEKRGVKMGLYARRPAGARRTGPTDAKLPEAEGNDRVAGKTGPDPYRSAPAAVGDLNRIYLGSGASFACWFQCRITVSISSGITSPSGHWIQAELRVSSGRDKYP